MKIYLAGPMTGVPDYNYPAFNAMAAKLRAEGHFVYNPAEFPHEGSFPIREAFSEFTNWICTEADAIYALHGWQWSKGADAEVALGKALGLEIMEGGK